MNDLTVQTASDADGIRTRILTIRGVQVMLDRDLAELYGVPTKRLNEQVKRNARRFPASFMFQLTKAELEDWRSQIATSNKGGANGTHLVSVNCEDWRSQIATLNAVKVSDKFHDRFLVIDRTTLIHVGASLNHLGKKCFAFASLDKSNIPDILAKL